MHFLLVDDSKVSLKILKKQILSIQESNIYCVDNGEKAVESYKRLHKKSEGSIIILMDINMPIVNGIEATKKIRHYENANNIEPNKRCKIIVTTDYEDERAKFLAQMVGANSFINKPISSKKIKDELIKFECIPA